MTHEEFFLAAIDPGERHDSAVRREVVKHRRDCLECRELERDYVQIQQLARRPQRKVAPPPPAVLQRVLAAGEENCKRRLTRKKAARAQTRRAVLVPAGLMIFLVVMGAFGLQLGQLPRVLAPVDGPCGGFRPGHGTVKAAPLKAVETEIGATDSESEMDEMRPRFTDCLHGNRR